MSEYMRSDRGEVYVVAKRAADRSAANKRRVDPPEELGDCLPGDEVQLLCDEDATARWRCQVSWQYGHDTFVRVWQSKRQKWGDPQPLASEREVKLLRRLNP